MASTSNPLYGYVEEFRTTAHFLKAMSAQPYETAGEHPDHLAVVWVPLSGTFLLLALSPRTATEAPQADDQTPDEQPPPVSLTKDEAQP
ncbi:hypothetical protein ACWDFL_32050 [Streptomyces bungoensis]